MTFLMKAFNSSDLFRNVAQAWPKLVLVFFMSNFKIFFNAILFVHFFNRPPEGAIFPFVRINSTSPWVFFAQSEWVEEESGNLLPDRWSWRVGQGSGDLLTTSHDTANRKWVSRRCEPKLSVVVYLICTDGERMSGGQGEKETHVDLLLQFFTSEFCAKKKFVDRRQEVGWSGGLQVQHPLVSVQCLVQAVCFAACWQRLGTVTVLMEKKKKRYHLSVESTVKCHFCQLLFVVLERISVHSLRLFLIPCTISNTQPPLLCSRCILGKSDSWF